MPFFTMSPTSRMSPMKLDTLSAVPVSRSSTSAPTNDSGAASSTTSGSTNDRNCTTITAITLTIASASTSSSARNAVCWLAYRPPSSTRMPSGAGFARQDPLHVVHHLAERAPLHAGGDRDHLLLVLAEVLAEHVGRREVGQRGRAAPRAPCAASTPGSAPSRRALNRTESGARTRTPMDRSSERISPARRRAARR